MNSPKVEVEVIDLVSSSDESDELAVEAREQDVGRTVHDKYDSCVPHECKEQQVHLDNLDTFNGQELINVNQTCTSQWVLGRLVNRDLSEYCCQVSLTAPSGEENEMIIQSKFVATIDTDESKQINVLSHVVCLDQTINKWLAGLVIDSFQKNDQTYYTVMLYRGIPIISSPKITFCIFDQKFNIDDFVSADFIRFFTNNWPTVSRISFIPGRRDQIFVDDEWVPAQAIECNGPLIKFRLDATSYIWVFNGDVMRLKSLYQTLQHHTSGSDSNNQMKQSSSQNESKAFKLIPSKMNGSELNVVTKQATVDLMFKNAFSKALQKSNPTCSDFKQKIQMSKNYKLKDKEKVLQVVPGGTTSMFIDFNYFNCIQLEDSQQSDLFDSIDFRQINSLVVPLIWGWKREKVKMTTGVANNFDKNDYIQYVSPCGMRIYGYKMLRRFLKEKKCSLEVDQFTFELDVNVDLQSEDLIMRGFRFEKDISYGQEPMMISAINSLSNEWFDPKFCYLSRRLAHNSVQINTDLEFMTGCTCDDDCSDPNKCECQLLSKDMCTTLPTLMRSGVWSYRNKRLMDRVITGIYECNPKCACSNRCHNRVVQNGIRNRLQVFRTDNKGWGVRVLHDIPRGSFVCDYSGVVCSNKVANQFGEQGTDIYLTDLDLIDYYEQFKEDYEDICASAGLTRPKKKRETLCRTRELYGEHDAYVLDGQICGNVGRFINHSCSPNLFVQSVFVDTHDLRFPWVAFFAKQNIKAMTELTWDYGYTVESVQDRQLDCHCGSENCRGRLL